MANLQLLIEDRGKTFKIQVGGEIELKLAENPSTGYQWTILSDPYPQLDLITEDFTADFSTGFGAEGYKTIRYLARSSGEITLSYAYIRPWEKEVPPADQYYITIIIQ